MQNNQEIKNQRPPHYSPAAWAAKCSMMAVIADAPRRLPPSEPPRNPYLEAHRLPAELLRDLVMTPKQAEGMDIVQRLCGHIRAAVKQINTAIVDYELGLTPLTMTEVGDLLLQADEHIIGARCAARRLGIRAVQPKLRLAQTRPSQNTGSKQRTGQTA